MNHSITRPITQPLTRRQVIQIAAVGGLALQANAAEPFTLPKLPYAFNALEPHIDATTMEIHYTKHHQTYVDNLNKVVRENAVLQGLPLEQLFTKMNDLPPAAQTALKNNGGGHLNHSLFWQCLESPRKGQPTGKLQAAIQKSFGDQKTLEERLKSAATGVFGSGWAWLVLDSGKNLKVISTPNQDPTILQGLQPVLGIDVWEHAYYLKYQNRRPEYLGAIFNVLNWSFITSRYEKLTA